MTCSSIVTDDTCVLFTLLKPSDQLKAGHIADDIGPVSVSGPDWSPCPPVSIRSCSPSPRHQATADPVQLSLGPRHRTLAGAGPYLSNVLGSMLHWKSGTNQDVLWTWTPRLFFMSFSCLAGTLCHPRLSSADLLFYLNHFLGKYSNPVLSAVGWRNLNIV